MKARKVGTTTNLQLDLFSQSSKFPHAGLSTDA